MNKKVLSLLVLPLLVTACSGGGGSNSGSGSTSGGDPEIVNIDTDEYDSWANSWSKPGHLYFHYNRISIQTNH